MAPWHFFWSKLRITSKKKPELNRTFPASVPFTRNDPKALYRRHGGLNMGFNITEILELYNDILPEFKVFIISKAWHGTPEKEELGDSGFWSLPSTPFLGPALLCN